MSFNTSILLPDRQKVSFTMGLESALIKRERAPFLRSSGRVKKVAGGMQCSLLAGLLGGCMERVSIQLYKLKSMASHTVQSNAARPGPIKDLAKVLGGNCSPASQCSGTRSQSSPALPVHPASQRHPFPQCTVILAGQGELAYSVAEDSPKRWRRKTPLLKHKQRAKHNI